MSMTFRELKKRKSSLFVSIMVDKYAGIRPKGSTVAEYRYLQREERRRIARYKRNIA